MRSSPGSAPGPDHVLEADPCRRLSYTWHNYQPEHAELFDPLLRLFERGIELRVDAGEVLLRGAGVPLGAWRG